MKRFIVLLGTLFLLLCAVTACGREAFDRELELENVYQSILTAQGEKQEELILFPESDPGYFESFYPGLNDIELAQQVYYIAPIAGAACEVLLVEVTRQEGVQTVRDIFQSRIDRAAADTVYPDVAEVWARTAQVQFAGPYVAMIALPDGFIIPENVFQME